MILKFKDSHWAKQGPGSSQNSDFRLSTETYTPTITGRPQIYLNKFLFVVDAKTLWSLAQLEKTLSRDPNCEMHCESSSLRRIKLDGGRCKHLSHFPIL